MARPSEFDSIYLDSSAFIAAIKQESGSEPIGRVLDLADQQRMTIYASVALRADAMSAATRSAP